MNCLKNGNFEIYFDDKNTKEVKMVFDELKKSFKNTMDFFGLKKLDKPVKVIIYGDLEKYKEHINPYLKAEGEGVTEWQDWMCGDTYDGNINLLSIDECHTKTKMHSDMSETEFCETPRHEFVHVCQQLVDKSPIQPSWLWEGIATQLTNATYLKMDKKIPHTAQQLIEEFKNLDDSYNCAYTLVGYLMKNLNHKQMLALIKNHDNFDLQGLIDDYNSKFEIKTKNNLEK